MRALTYLVASSLDGYIASPDGGFDDFAMQGDHVDALFRDYPETLPGAALAAAGITARNETFDTVVMGWNTFAVGLRYGQLDPYPHLRQYVCSRTHSADEAGGEVVVTGEDPVELVRRLKAEPSARDIWLCGGGRLAAVLSGEIDRLVLKVNPVLLGSGIRALETDAYRPRAFRLTSSRTFGSGVVMNGYERA